MKNTQTQDQIKVRKSPYKSIEHKQISFSQRNTEFFQRQQLYDDLNNSNQFKIEQFKFIGTQKGNIQSKFKEVIESAKSKFASSPNNHKNTIIHQQQNSMKEIVEQLRKQKRTNNIQLKNNENSLKKINQLNLNYFLVIAITLICYLVVLLEMIRPERTNSK
ncbi:unnamed protein product [Paramecium primaurelia]|uniref:Transmembrane protein n=1 Tax=Paramecium primaurelia TaxID=5886 RepID=A0A8S1NQX9_PARPR|nr:unnamed protein product [Paramecium primaurelia]